MDRIERYGVFAEHEIAPAEGRSIKQHEHPFYEVYFLVSGSRRYLMRHTVYDVTPGDLVLVPKRQLHRTVSTARTGYDRYVLYFSERQAERVASLLGEEDATRLFECGCLSLPPAATSRLRTDMEAILGELRSPDRLSEALLTALLQSILTTALRHGVPKDGLSGEGADKVQHVAQYVFEHYAEDISLAKAARMACLERTYFSRRFKQLTGFGFCEYLLRTRLLAARRLLTESSLPLTRIAEACGFESANYFGDVFRRYEGCSPSAYRRASTSPRKSPDFP